MEKAVTAAQLKKIHVLARERGLDGELLHSHTLILTGKESLRQLTLKEAVKLIDSLEGAPVQDGKERATGRQMNYIRGLMKQAGWVTENGRPDMNRLDRFLQSPKAGFNIGSHKWLSKEQAGSLIEALKQMSGRR